MVETIVVVTAPWLASGRLAMSTDAGAGCDRALIGKLSVRVARQRKELRKKTAVIEAHRLATNVARDGNPIVEAIARLVADQVRLHAAACKSVGKSIHSATRASLEARDGFVGVHRAINSRRHRIGDSSQYSSPSSDLDSLSEHVNGSVVR